MVLLLLSYPVWGEFRFHFNRAFHPDLFVERSNDPIDGRDVMGVTEGQGEGGSGVSGGVVPQISGDSIEIPSIGLIAPLYTGTDESLLDKGAWLKRGNSTFGQAGNKVITGHKFRWRSGEGVFYNLPKVGLGDTVVLNIGGRQYKYAVVREFQVGSHEIWIEKDSPADTLTLYTCTTLDSSRRFVLVAEPL